MCSSYPFGSAVISRQNSLLMKKAVNDLTGYELITIKCSSQLTAAYVLYILKQVSLHATSYYLMARTTKKKHHTKQNAYQLYDNNKTI